MTPSDDAPHVAGKVVKDIERHYHKVILHFEDNTQLVVTIRKNGTLLTYLHDDTKPE